MQGKQAKRGVRGRRRRTQARQTVLPWQYDPPPVLDNLEHLSPPFGFSASQGTISQILISSDRFLSYAWRSHLFAGKFTAVFPSLDAARFRLEDPWLSSLIVDMESLTVSRFAALETLREKSLLKGDLRCWLLVSRQDPPMRAFLQASGGFELLARDQSLPQLREALLAPPLRQPLPRFSVTEWQLITLLAQGQTLKESARQLRMPYHRAVYRIMRLLQRLDLPSRQHLTQLLHLLMLDMNH